VGQCLKYFLNDLTTVLPERFDIHTELSLCKDQGYYIPGSSLLYSRMFPGWHFSARHIASRVDSFIVLAFPFLRTDRFEVFMPIISDSSFSFILRFASITSRFTIIAMFYVLSPEFTRFFIVIQ